MLGSRGTWPMLGSWRRPSRRRAGPVLPAAAGAAQAEAPARQAEHRGGRSRCPSLAPNVDIVDELARFVARDKSIGCHVTLPILMRLAREKSTGVYDRERAIDAFMGLAEQGARAYLRERGHDPREWDSTFGFSARLTAAWRWQEEFERQFERGAYDSLLRDPQE